MIKNLKSLFIVEDKEGKKEKNKETQQTPQEGQNTGAAASAPKDVSGEVTEDISGGKADEKIIDALFGALEENNLSGFDYFEFKKSLNSLARMVEEEATRFKSAFATASTMGVTMDKLIETAEHYKGILESERAKFNQAVKMQRSEMIDKKNEELESIRKAIEEKKQQIEDLKKEILSSESKLGNIEGKIELARQKILETQKNFESSFENIKGQIQDDIEKMKKYLK